MQVSEKITRTLDKAKLRLIDKKSSTFITTVLFSMKQVWTNEIPTAAVDGKRLLINPDWWMNSLKNTEQRIFLLAHEAWHLAFDHLLVDDTINKQKWNIAGDYVINLMLKEAGYEMPEGGYLDYQYCNMSTRQVYEKLPDLPKDESMKGFGEDLLDNPNMTQEEKEDLKQELDQVIIKAHTAAEMNNEDVGSLPGDIKLKIDELLNPKLPWQTILQNFMSAFHKDNYSFQRPNRRFMPDFYLPSMHSEGLGEIAIAVDTSGSVSDSEFKAFLTEINDIKEKLNPKLTTIIDFDTSIKHVHKISQDANVKGLPFTGRGGTDLDCVFKYYNKTKPEVLIVFSDLWCDRIEEDPGYPVIWICVNNTNAKVNFGTLIHYEID